jgi:response regulator of citrate/malate metabolism
MKIMENNKIALIIDDDPGIHIFLEHIFKFKGIRHINAENLGNAKELLVSNSPDIIFLDNYLPDGQGIEHISHLHEISPNSKIVAMTSEHELRHKALKNGAIQFLGKPLSIKEINCTLEAYA